MENAQRILILHAIMLSLNCLNAEEGATAAKRYLFINAAEPNQDRYFENTLTSEFGSKDMILWKGDSCFVFTEDGPCGLLLSQYGMIDHTLMKGCCEHLQKFTLLNF